MSIIVNVPEEDAAECMLEDVVNTLRIRYKKVEDNFVFHLPALTNVIMKELDDKGYKLVKEEDESYTVEFKYFI